jgi:hypothetical protein
MILRQQLLAFSEDQEVSIPDYRGRNQMAMTALLPVTQEAFSPTTTPVGCGVTRKFWSHDSWFDSRLNVLGTNVAFELP